MVKGKKDQGGSNIAGRFGLKTPQLPQMPQISAPELKVGGFQGLYGKKEASKEPEPLKETCNGTPTTQFPTTAVTVQEPEEPESLVSEINDCTVTKPDVQEVPVEFKPLFENLEAPKLDGVYVGRQKSKTAKTSSKLIDKMICPDPIMLTISGIEGLFDIQRIIKKQDPESLRYQVKSAVNESQQISGQCTISAALSNITVNFSCTTGVLGKQLDVCGVVHRVLFPVKHEKAASAST